MMSEIVKNRYSDKDLEEFKLLIEGENRKSEARSRIVKSSYMNNGNNGTEDTSPNL